MLGSSDFPDKASFLKSDTDDNLVKLKELLSRFTAYSKFVEFLVPVEISNLQLEQYCGELLANASALRSNCRTDHVGAFKEILMKLRKVCIVCLLTLHENFLPFMFKLFICYLHFSSSI